MTTEQPQQPWKCPRCGAWSLGGHGNGHDNLIFTWPTAARGGYVQEPTHNE